MSNYLEHIKKVTGVDRDMARATSVVGSAMPDSLKKFLASEETPKIHDGIGTVVGAVAGAYVGQRHGGHWLLGSIGGGSIGRNGPALFDKSPRRDALCNMGETGFALAVARAVPKHPGVAFVVAKLAAGAITYAAKLRG